MYFPSLATLLVLFYRKMSFSLFLSLSYPILLLPLHPGVLLSLSSSSLPLFFLPFLPPFSSSLPFPRRIMWAERGILPPTMSLPRLHSPTLLPPPQTAAQPSIGIITVPVVPVIPVVPVVLRAGVLRSTTHRPVLSSSSSTAVHRVGAVGGFPCARPTA